MEKNWKFKPNPDAQSVSLLAQEITVPYDFAALLTIRGVSSFLEAKQFFNPQLDALHDPFLMCNMALAAERLKKAIDKGEKILVYGDYDVDGTTSVAMMYSFLKRFTEQVEFYIPDRYEEGYGVSRKGLEYASLNDFRLVITLDCGIKSVGLINEFSDAIDFIICDHHEPGAELPQALVLDPKIEQCTYPYKELSGCGVGFKLIQATLIDLGEDVSLSYEYIDLVAISIASDIVPMTGENRVLMKFGLEKINASPSKAISALIGERKNKDSFSVMDVVFGIAPKINAAGRIESALSAVKLLIAESDQEIQKYITQIESFNEDRKQRDSMVALEAIQQIKDLNEEDAYATVVYQKDWSKGVIGIAASRLIETYYRPTIVLTKSGDHWSGSARSVHGYSVYQAIEACEEHLIQFGGHKYAAGLTIHEKKIAPFKAAFLEYVKNTITEEQLAPTIEIDREISLSNLKPERGEVFPKLYRLIKRMAPFGPMNMRPIFLIRDLIAVDARVVGQDHLKLRVKHEDYSLVMDAIAFNMAHLFNDIQNQPFHMVAAIEENEWNGRLSLQLMVKDIKLGQLDL